MPQFDLDGYSPDMVLEILTGREPIRESLFSQVFQPEMISTMSGQIPHIPSKYTILSNEENYKHEVAIDDVPNIIDVDLEGVDFQFDGKLSHEARVHKKQVRQIEQRLNGIEGEALIEYLGSLVLGFINTAYDLQGASVLKDTSQNANINANAAWSDKQNADIFDDFDRAEDQCGSIEVAWIGLDKARDARELPALKEYAGKHFDATGGRVSRGNLATMIREEYDAEQVIIGEKEYINKNNQAKSSDYKDIFQGVSWVGREDHFLALQQNSSPEALDEADSGYLGRNQQYFTYAHAYREISRGEKEGGVVIQNT